MVPIGQGSVIGADRDGAAKNYGELPIDGSGFRDAADALGGERSGAETGVEMTAAQPIAAVTAALARIRTDRWLGRRHGQTAAE